MSSPNKDLGPCIVVWNGRGVALGETVVTYSKTFGGVFFRYEELRAEVKRDQAGETHVDDVTTGVVNPELEVPMTQEEIARLVECYANAEAVALGTIAASMRVSNPVGENVYPLTRQVIAKPIVNGVISATATEWLYIHRAFPRVTMEQAYDNSGQRTVKVIFKGFPDDVCNRSNELWRYGLTV